MLSLLSQLSFANAWILIGLLALPALWYLLKLTPPPPRTITLATARFLRDLIPQAPVSQKTPWWLLLLRTLFISLLIFALAGPAITPQSKTPAPGGDVLILIENDWAAAQNWSDITKTAKHIIQETSREKHAIYLATTAPLKPQNDIQGPLLKDQALSYLNAIKPNPWRSETETLAPSLSAKNVSRVHFLSSGLETGISQTLQSEMNKKFIIHYPDAQTLPAVITNAELRANGLHVATTRAGGANTNTLIQILDKDDRLLTQNTGDNIKREGTQTTSTIAVAPALHDHIHTIKLPQSMGANAVFLTGNLFKNRTAGIVSRKSAEQTQSLADASFYLTKALSPFGEVKTGQIEQLLAENVGLMILPDIANIPEGALEKLERWTENGGILLRFAGPNLAQSNTPSPLLPVPLRYGLRGTDGPVSWERAQKLTHFEESSPFYTISIPEDITFTRQILADPAFDIEDKIWARLEDGTPLITADKKERGLIVFIHTAATPDWSNLPLSGLYVDILQKLLDLSTYQNKNAIEKNTVLKAGILLDGFGNNYIPSGGESSLSAGELENLKPSREHPPGLYSSALLSRPLNLGPSLYNLEPLQTNAPNMTYVRYQSETNIDLRPYAFYAALFLLLIDLFILIILFGWAGQALRLTSLFLVCLLCLLLPTHNAKAQEINADYANNFYLGFIRTGDIAIDQASEAGLKNIARVLRQRTSIEPKGVAGLAPISKEILFFPFIYWPISNSPQAMNAAERQNIQNYLDQGGFIIFDMQTANTAPSSAKSRHLRVLMNGLILPSLTPPRSKPCHQQKLLPFGFLSGPL